MRNSRRSPAQRAVSRSVAAGRAQRAAEERIEKRSSRRMRKLDRNTGKWFCVFNGNWQDYQAASDLCPFVIALYRGNGYEVEREDFTNNIWARRRGA